MERAIDRLLQFIEYLKRTENEVRNTKAFEKKCGLSNSYIANAKKSNGSIGSDMLAKIISSFPQLNVKWLCTGSGDMIQQEMIFLSEILGDRRITLEISKDNSMFPVIEQGSMVAVTKDAESEVICGHIYAVYLPDNSVFFRYIASVTEDSIVVVPCNKEVQYGKEQTIKKKNILKISKVVGAVKAFV